MPRLRLIQLPVPPPAAFADTGNVPLAAGTLAVAADVHGLTDRGLEVEVVAPDVTDALGDRMLAEHVAADAPEFVGLSLYLWNVERSLHLARAIKARSPGTTILVGGPEVSGDQDFVLSEGGFDIAVAGEAEDRFALLMERLLAGEDVGDIPGVGVRAADGAFAGFGAAAVPNFRLAEYPSPYVHGSLAIDSRRSAYVETVRGCASKCAYCFYPRSSTNLRSLEHDRVRQLIRVLHAGGARDVSFLDPTFNHRADLEELLQLLAEENGDRQLQFFGEVRPEGLTAEHAKALARCGFTKLELGLQSVNVETLKRVQRYGNPDRVAAAAEMLRGEGIDLFIDLIIGLPGDTPEDVVRGVEFLLAHDLTRFAQVFPLSVLPGTAMRNRATEFGLEFDPAPPYRVSGTETFDTDALTDALFAAEDALDRRLDETPRLHLVTPDSQEAPRSTFAFTLEVDALDAVPPGARHCAFWYFGDPYGSLDAIRRQVAAHLEREPYGVLDVVLCPDGPFPLDVLDAIDATFDAARIGYQSRVLQHRGENLQRRIGVVLREDVGVPDDWVAGLLDVVPVFRDMPGAAAVDQAAELGVSAPGARVTDTDVDLEALRRADPEHVTFCDRNLERRWQREVIGYG